MARYTRAQILGAVAIAAGAALAVRMCDSIVPSRENAPGVKIVRSDMNPEGMENAQPAPPPPPPPVMTGGFKIADGVYFKSGMWGVEVRVPDSTLFWFAALVDNASGKDAEIRILAELIDSNGEVVASKGGRFFVDGNPGATLKGRGVRDTISVKAGDAARVSDVRFRLVR